MFAHLATYGTFVLALGSAVLAGAGVLASREPLSRACYRIVVRRISMVLAALALSVAGHTVNGDTTARFVCDIPAIFVTYTVGGWLIYRVGLLRSATYQREKMHKGGRQPGDDAPQDSQGQDGQKGALGSQQEAPQDGPDVHAILRRSVMRRAQIHATLLTAQADHAAWTARFRVATEVPDTM